MPVLSGSIRAVLRVAMHKHAAMCKILGRLCRSFGLFHLFARLSEWLRSFGNIVSSPKRPVPESFLSASATPAPAAPATPAVPASRSPNAYSGISPNHPGEDPDDTAAKGEESDGSLDHPMPTLSPIPFFTISTEVTDTLRQQGIIPISTDWIELNRYSQQPTM
jgi:hypothetical protein